MKFMPEVLPGASWGPPALAEESGGGAMSPFIPTAGPPGLRGCAMPGQPAGSQLCCPAAPSPPAMSAHLGWNLPPEGDPIVPQTRTGSLLQPARSLHFPSREQMDRQSVFPAQPSRNLLLCRYLGLRGATKRCRVNPWDATQRQVSAGSRAKHAS